MSLVTMDASRRYHGLDALRAFAMLLGVVLHVALAFQESPPDAIWPFRDPERTPFAGLLVVVIHLFRMPVFFVMAGFFAAMLRDRRGIVGLARNRCLRITVPFAVGWFVLFPLVKLSFVFAAKHSATPGIAKSFDFALDAVPPGKYWADAHPIHLWFLYYLMMLYVLAMIGAGAMRLVPESLRNGVSQGMAYLAVGRRRLPVLIAATFLLLLPMNAPSADTPSAFTPELHVLVFYGFFFFIGWATWLHRSVIEQLQRQVWMFGVGVTAMVPATGLIIAAYIVLFSKGGGSESAVYRVLFVLAQAAVACSVWLFILGGIGLTERIVQRHHPIIRYLVDASYWIYLAHLPLSVFIPSLFKDWAINGTLKMVVMMVLVTIPLLVMYQALRAMVPHQSPRGS